MSLSADRNLLFGILAVQMDFVSRNGLIEAMHAWVLDKSRRLDDVLVEKGFLTESRRQMLAPLVNEHIRQHDGDAQRSLAALSSVASLHEDLAKVGDTDVQASLRVLSASDPEVTRSITAATEILADSDDGQSNKRAHSRDSQRFRIIRPHAKGGLGEVYLAKDEELGREVALKEIQKEHARNSDSRDRFVREAEITGGLEHPGIVPVYGLGHYDDGRPYYAMRFIRGASLKEAIEEFHGTKFKNDRERNLKLRELLGRFVDVCNAIEYAHSRGVLHRDLKPGNIMLGKYGETLVVDWGLAKVAGRAETHESSAEATLSIASTSGSSETLPGSAIGTPAYMSPEQAEGKLDTLGPATDVYSLGATLYMLLVGKAAFDGSALEILEKVKHGDFVPPHTVDRRAPKALSAICAKAMAKMPEQRYASCSLLAVDVERWLADERVESFKEPLTARAGRWVRRHNSVVSAVGTLVAMGFVAMVASNLLLRTEQQKTESALLTAEEQRQRAESQEAIARSQAIDLTRQLYRQRIASASHAIEAGNLSHALGILTECPAELRDWEWGYLRGNCNGAVREWNAWTPGHEPLLALVPGSPKLVVVDRSLQTISLLDLQSGQREWTISAPERSTISQLACSGTAVYLAFEFDVNADQEFFIRKLRLSDGEMEAESAPMRGRSWSILTAPLGCHILSSEWRDGEERLTLRLWNSKSRDPSEVQTINTGFDHLSAVALSPSRRRTACAGRLKSRLIFSTGKAVHIFGPGSAKIPMSTEGLRQIGHLEFSGNESFLFGGGEAEIIQNVVCGWNIRKPSLAWTSREHSGEITRLVASSGRVVSCSQDRTFNVHDSASGEVLRAGFLHPDAVTFADVSFEGHVLTGAEDGILRLWDLSQASSWRELGHTIASEVVVDIAFGNDDSIIGTGLGTLNVWPSRDTETPTDLAYLLHDAVDQEAVEGMQLAANLPSILTKPDGSIAIQLAASSDGKLIAAATASGEVFITDQSNLAKRNSLEAFERDVLSVEVDSSGQLVGAVVDEKKETPGKVVLFDAESKVKLWEQQVLEPRAGLNFSRDGSLIAFFDGSEFVLMRTSDQALKGPWNRSREKKDAGEEAVGDISFSPDSASVAVIRPGSKEIELVDVATVKTVARLQLDGPFFREVAYFPSGTRLASLDSDGSLAVWDVVSREPVLIAPEVMPRLPGKPKDASELIVSRDGRRLAVSQIGSKVKVLEAVEDFAAR